MGHSRILAENVAYQCGDMAEKVRKLEREQAIAKAKTLAVVALAGCFGVWFFA